MNKFSAFTRNHLFPFFNKNLGASLFFVMLFIALFTYHRYGISWDEGMQRMTGYHNYNYAFKGDDSLLTWKDKDYGAGFELPLIILEKVFKLEDSRDIFLMRHFFTHLLFLISAFCLFKLVELMYKSKWLASLAFFMLVLHPRIYSHSFFNTKDIPFLAVFIIVFYLCAKAFKDKSIKNFIYLGIATGFLINVRIMGIMMPILISVLLSIDALLEKKYLENLKFGVVFLALTSLSLYITWPYLWENPIHNLIESYQNMSKFRFESAVLFNGEFVLTTKMPWYYIPVWFSITTPIVFTIVGLLGVLALLIAFVLKPIKHLKNNVIRNNFVFLGCLIGPLFAVIYLQSVLYDSWRQLFFVYPAFLLLAIYGISLLAKSKLKFIPITLFSLTFLYMIYFTVRQFPIQYVYFNPIVQYDEPEKLRKNWEMDYWGVSYRTALEYILNHDDGGYIGVAFDHPYVGAENIMILKPDQRKRLHVHPREDCNFFIVNYRWHPHDFEEFNGKEWHSFKLGNNTITKIFKLK
jgi:hypothetical protein